MCSLYASLAVDVRNVEIGGFGLEDGTTSGFEIICHVILQHLINSARLMAMSNVWMFMTSWRFVESVSSSHNNNKSRPPSTRPTMDIRQATVSSLTMYAS